MQIPTHQWGEGAHPKPLSNPIFLHSNTQPPLHTIFFSLSDYTIQMLSYLSILNWTQIKPPFSSPKHPKTVSNQERGAQKNYVPFLASIVEVLARAQQRLHPYLPLLLIFVFSSSKVRGSPFCWTQSMLAFGRRQPWWIELPIHACWKKWVFMGFFLFILQLFWKAMFIFLACMSSTFVFCFLVPWNNS